MNHHTLSAKLARQSLSGLTRCLSAGVLIAGILPQLGGVAEAVPNSNTVETATLEQTILNHGFVQRAVRLEGVVRAVLPEERLLALEDASGRGPVGNAAPAGWNHSGKSGRCRIRRLLAGADLVRCPNRPAVDDRQ